MTLDDATSDGSYLSSTASPTSSSIATPTVSPTTSASISAIAPATASACVATGHERRFALEVSVGARRTPPRHDVSGKTIVIERSYLDPQREISACTLRARFNTVGQANRFSEA